jgi:hypothetical protein
VTFGATESPGKASVGAQNLTRDLQSVFADRDIGANDVTSFFIAGPEGHILVDGGYPGTPPLHRRTRATDTGASADLDLRRRSAQNPLREDDGR